MTNALTPLVTTSDGSYTLKSEVIGECYHSTNGAIQESLHVFINAGFKHINKPHINILEVGFGTGLNAMLSLLEAEKSRKNVYYESLETYPISVETAAMLNYPELLNVDKDSCFMKLHRCEWEKEVAVTPFFSLMKRKTDIQAFTPSPTLFNLVYFDAFSPDTQPELWSLGIFSSLYKAMASESMLVTYCSKGIVKQRLREIGFTVNRLQGAMGKRHMLQAVKL